MTEYYRIEMCIYLPVTETGNEETAISTVDSMMKQIGVTPDQYCVLSIDRQPYFCRPTVKEDEVPDNEVKPKMRLMKR
jgi:hypothetical protein